MTDTGTQPNGGGGFDDPAAVYNHLKQCAEQLTPRDPAALNQIIETIFSAGTLSDAERVVLLAIVREKSGLTVEEFKQVTRPFEQRRRNGKPNGAGNHAAPIENPAPDSDQEPLWMTAEAMETIFERQVVMDRHCLTASVLWSIATWGYESADIFPRFFIHSPAPRCGKTTLLLTTGAFVTRPLFADNISASPLFRLVDDSRPSLLIDEVDSFIGKDSDIPNMLNAGYRKDGCVIRSVQTPDGKSWVPAMFNVFGPVAIAGIGRTLPPQTLDRSIIVTLQRARSDAPKKAGEKRQRQRRLRVKDLKYIRDQIAPQLAAWADDVAAAIDRGVPEDTVPYDLNDRAAENWLPAFAVADLIGRDWPARVRQAALALSSRDEDRTTHGELLLSDLRDIITEQRAAAAAAVRHWWKQSGRLNGVGRADARSIAAWYAAAPKKVLRATPRVRPDGCPITKLVVFKSDELVMTLNDRETRPWAGYKSKNGGLTRETMASMLKRFRISPEMRRDAVLAKQMGWSATTPIRGYRLKELRPVWKRYLSGD